VQQPLANDSKRFEAELAQVCQDIADAADAAGVELQADPLFMGLLILLRDNVEH